ncbi:hypothetical protein [Spirosoma aerolatum]|uniref:hypothetical protein n=1 Tax=Spirosoma aerolatum TaxID=1211326 RepID=UPI001FE653C9|nr:hypothetical protein [Spirosoma aerolatum]
MPNSSELTGGPTSQRSVGKVPSGMDNDPNADEEVIDQRTGEDYPKPVDADQNQPENTQSAKIAPDDLAESIAYAIDGSGPGPTNETPNVSAHKVISEGITGAGPEEEDENLKKKLKS